MMDYDIIDTIMGIHDVISSIIAWNFGFFFIIVIVVIFFSCYMIYSFFVHRKRTILEKVIFIPTIVISVVLIFDFILAGDVYPDLPPERMAREFAAYLCSGDIAVITRDKNRFLAPDFYNTFIEEWVPKSDEFTEFYPYASYVKPFFGLVEYHYVRPSFKSQQRCKVVLRDWIYINDVKTCDLDLIIYLTKVGQKSRLVNGYLRWRVSGFSYTLSEPYPLNDHFE